MTDYPPHELASLFPPMGDTDYANLRDSIAEHGLMRAITLYDGKVLDGIHRQRATGEVGVEPRYEQYDGDDPLGFALAMNLARRQLNTTERAKLGARIAARTPDPRIGHKRLGTNVPNRRGKTTVEVGAAVSVSGQSIMRALRLLREAPELFEQMDGRKLTVGGAYKRLEAKPSGGQRRRPKLEDPRSLDEQRAARHMREVAAWKRVVAVNAAVQRMWVERETVLAAIDNCRDPGAVEALAGQASHVVWQMREVADRAFARMNPEQRARVDALMLARGWPVDRDRAASR